MHSYATSAKVVAGWTLIALTTAGCVAASASSPPESPETPTPVIAELSVPQVAPERTQPAYPSLEQPVVAQPAPALAADEAADPAEDAAPAEYGAASSTSGVVTFEPATDIPPAPVLPPEYAVLLATRPAGCSDAEHRYGDLSALEWPEVAIRIIAAEEGYDAYWKDIGDGMWTIGYGHAVPKSHARDVAEPLSADQAANLLLNDLIHNSYVQAAFNWFGADISQQSFGAMVSFAYNTGPGGFAKYSIPHVNSYAVATAISHASDSKQPQFPGLLCRRAREADILLRYGEIGLSQTPFESGPDW